LHPGTQKTPGDRECELRWGYLKGGGQVFKKRGGRESRAGQSTPLGRGERGEVAGVGKLIFFRTHKNDGSLS